MPGKRRWRAAWVAIGLFFFSGLCGGKDVSLVVNDVPISEAAKVLERESGYKIECWGEELKGKRVTLDLKNVPFFQALLALAKAANCGYSPARTRGYVLEPGPAYPRPTHTEGPFQFRILKIARELDFSSLLASAKPVLRLWMHVQWEPKVWVGDSRDTVHIVSAKTDQGQSLTLVTIDEGPRGSQVVRTKTSSSVSSLSQQYYIQLNPPEAAGGHLAELKGYVTLNVAELTGEIRFENPLRATNEKRAAGEAEVTLVSFTPRDGGFNAVLTFARKSSEERQPGLRASSPLSGGELVLLDDAGRTHSPQGESWTREGSSHRMGLQFAELPEGRTPAALVFRFPASPREVDVEFEFKNVPLP
ncbi:MAG: hypothetical protein FJ279_15140 [Planctomycetes bacterium]|nr:hypothetical protein [Planctomycetota bacterium]